MDNYAVAAQSVKRFCPIVLLVITLFHYANPKNGARYRAAGFYLSSLTNKKENPDDLGAMNGRGALNITSKSGNNIKKDVIFMMYGYARVSTKEQNEERQLDALRFFGVPNENVYLDKVSGKDFKRPEYEKVLGILGENDIFVVKSIDRLGRDYAQIIEQWRKITKEIKAMPVILDMPLLDTRQRERDLTGTFIADITLQLLSYVAQIERAFIKQRQAEGIAAAKERGVKFGPQIDYDTKLFEKCKEDYLNGEISSRNAAAVLGISHTTFLKLVRD